MMDQQIASRLRADLFLLHARSVYDFRERDDMLFAYLSDSDSVNVTSLYEMYPIGWFSIKQRLADAGTGPNHRVQAQKRTNTRERACAESSAA